MMYRGVLSRVLAPLVLLTVSLTGVSGTLFIVGGSRNWIVPNAGLNYTTWARNISAHVGDSLYFKYSPNGHNVLRVTSTAFVSCNTSFHLNIWDNGDTTVPLEEAGTEYFICGAPRHCYFGQAFSLDVRPAAVSNSTPSSAVNSTVFQNSQEPSAVITTHPWLTFVILNAAIVCVSLLF